MNDNSGRLSFFQSLGIMTICAVAFFSLVRLGFLSRTYKPFISSFCNEPLLEEDSIFTCTDKWEGLNTVNFTPDGERLIQIEDSFLSTEVSIIPFTSWLSIPQKHLIELSAEEHYYGVHMPLIFENWIVVELDDFSTSAMNLRIWDYEQKQLVKLLTNVAPYGIIGTSGFSSDGLYLAIGVMRDGQHTKVWNTNTWDSNILPGSGLMTFIPGTHHLAILSSSYALLIWDVDADLQIQQINLGIKLEKPNELLISPNGEYLAVLEGKKSIYLFETKTWQLISEIPVTNGILGTQMAFSPDSQFLATLEDKIIPVVPGEELPKDLGHFQQDPSCPNPMGCVTALIRFGYLKLWETKTGTLFHTVDFGEQNTWVRGLAFSPDGTKIVLSGETNFLLEKKP